MTNNGDTGGSLHFVGDKSGQAIGPINGSICVSKIIPTNGQIHGQINGPVNGQVIKKTRKLNSQGGIVPHGGARSKLKMTRVQS